MVLSEIASVLNARIVCGQEKLSNEVYNGFASDMMSDVLTLQVDNMILITGLANIQTIRTAEMADITYILLVRNKKMPEEVVRLAEENRQVILETSFSMFKSCGLLFQAGLKPIY